MDVRKSDGSVEEFSKRKLHNLIVFVSRVS